MKILKGILSESKEYYLNARKQIVRKIARLPRGSIKERKISGRKYYYLQKREDKKIMHKYLGKSKPEALIREIKQRNALRQELKKVNEALKILKRSEGKQR